MCIYIEEGRVQGNTSWTGMTACKLPIHDTLCKPGLAAHTLLFFCSRNRVKKYKDEGKKRVFKFFA